MDVRIAVESTPPESRPLKEPDPVPVIEAVRTAGATLTTVDEANALIWLRLGSPDLLVKILDDHPAITWVQLPWAGVEGFAAAGVFARDFGRDTVFTCAKASFARQVGEHALALILASYRHIVPQSRRARWHPIDPESLFGRSVTVLGAGGIAEVLLGLLAPFGCHVRVLRRRPDPFPGADETLPIDRLHEVLPSTDVLVVALALTPETRGVVGAAELALLPPHAVLVNVARGGHVDTDALTAAVEAGGLAAAALDVTDPEPLPEGHPLWTSDRVLISSHCADGTAFITEMLAARVRTNIARFAAGEPLDGVVDPSAGY